MTRGQYGTVVTELEIPVLQEHADAKGSAGSRLVFTDEGDESVCDSFRTTRQGETALRLPLWPGARRCGGSEVGGGFPTFCFDVMNVKGANVSPPLNPTRSRARR